MWGWTLMSESKPSEKVDNEASDELAVLRAQHTLSSSSTMESLARTRDRLDEENTLGIIKKIEKGFITPPEKKSIKLN